MEGLGVNSSCPSVPFLLWTQGHDGRAARRPRDRDLSPGDTGPVCGGLAAPRCLHAPASLGHPSGRGTSFAGPSGSRLGPEPTLILGGGPSTWFCRKRSCRLGAEPREEMSQPEVARLQPPDPQLQTLPSPCLRPCQGTSRGQCQPGPAFLELSVSGQSCRPGRSETEPLAPVRLHHTFLLPRRGKGTPFHCLLPSCGPELCGH